MPNEVFYDSWAWLETIAGTTIGERLERKYGAGRPGRIHTSILAMAEVASRIARTGHVDLVRPTLRRMEVACEDRIHPITLEDVEVAASLHVELRRKADASLADALILAQALRLRLPLVSGDRAFRGRSDVIEG